MVDEIAVAIGSLRWRVTLARRAQVPDPDGVGLIEGLQAIETLRADIQPISALTFWAAASGGGDQVDTPVTHRIRMRWVDSLSQDQVILRATLRPDGSTRTEVFRVRRIKELNGRKRFVEIEAELERVR